MLLVQPTVVHDRGISVAFEIDFSIHRGDMDKPSWGPANGGKVQNNWVLKYVCNKPRPFLFQFLEKYSKNHDFDDLGKAVMNILDLVCSNGPAR